MVHPVVSVIIVTWNSEREIEGCLASVLQTQLPIEVIIVDNASSDGTVSIASKFDSVKLVLNADNLGFGRANNLGIRMASGKYVLLLNPDTVVMPGAIEHVTVEMETNLEFGLVGCELLDPDLAPQRSAFMFPTPLYDLCLLVGRYLNPLRSDSKEKEYSCLREVHGFLTGAFMMFRKDVLTEIGGFDDRIFMYGEDVDIAYRCIRAGWKIGYCSLARVIHVGNASGSRAFGQRRLAMVYRGIAYFQKKHFGAYWVLGLILRAFALGFRVMGSWVASVVDANFGSKYKDAVCAFKANLGRE